MRKAVLKQCLLISVLFFMMGCSGTETGNPDISFCAEEIFNTYDSTDVWMPEHYLYYGEDQLSPDMIYADVSTHMLHKRTSPYAEGDSVWIDTVITSTPIIVTDTIHTYRDSTETVINDNGDTVKVSRRYSDSIFVHDTVMVYDTSYMERSFDDVPIQFKPRAASYQLILVDSCGYPTYSVEMGSSHINFSSRNTKTVSTRDMTSLSRSMNRGDTVVFEAYYDADGDSLLFESDGPDSPEVELEATYLVSNGTEITISSFFDGGDDGNIKTSENNRIHAFEKRMHYPGGKSEVTYKASGRGGMPVFTMAQGFASEPVESVTVKCEFSEPSDDHRLSALTKVDKSALYSDRRHNRMDLQLSFSDPVSYKTRGGECFVLAVLHLPGNRTATLEGRLVSGGNLFMGIYKEGNESKAVQIYRNGTMLFTDL
ncbi:MAG: hypothetical protein ACLFVE_14715 [Chitinispirillaceae bacterium]